MRRTTLIAALVMMVAGAAYAATKDNKVSVTGYIIDNACSAKFHDADGVKGHPKSCALMDGCVKSGYAVFSDGKYYKLDKTGNAKAHDIIKASSADKGIQVKVEGTLDGDTIKVSSISAVM